MGVTEETGEAGFWRRTADFWSPSNMPIPRMAYPVELPSPPSAPTQTERLDKALQENLQILREIASNTTPAKREQVSLRTEGGF